MANFAKPENALKRAEELINVGQKQDALQALHNLITSKRYRAWQKPLERIMFKYVELCVDMRKGRFAKDGLIQYRIVCQQVNVSSLEEVIRHFMHLSTEKAEKARSEAQTLEEALDVDDLEADKRPEDLMLSYVSGEKGKDRSDRELVTPWFKFLWETYRTVLEILRNNSKLEALYSMTAHRAFQFCKQYKRTTEFRRLCEIIRNHLVNLNKYKDQRDRPDLSAPESLQLYLDTRFEQLKIATELGLWQAAIFTMLMPVLPYDQTRGASHSELENEKERNIRMANLIGFNLETKLENREVFSRSSLLTELASKGVLSCATQEVKDLYHLLEHDFLPLDAASKIQPLLLKISKLGGKLASAASVSEVQISKYVPALEKLSTLRLLKQVSHVYQSMKIESMSQIIPFFYFSMVEKISVDAVKHKFIAMKVDHMKGAVVFGDMGLESDELRDHLTLLAESLNKARAMIYPSANKASKLSEVLPGLGEIVDKEHKRLLASKSIIEIRKEEQERQLLEMEREEESKRLMLQKKTEEAEKKRLATVFEQQRAERIRKEIEERELDEAQALLQETEKHLKKGKKKPILDGEKLTKQTLLERAMNEQLKERQEQEKRLQKVAKTMDHLERAKREEAAPLIEAAFQRRQRHDGDLREKNRLIRMLENKMIFQERVISRRQTEFDQRKVERQERIKQIMQARKQERDLKRKKIFYVRSEEERIRKQREEEEARKREEAERRRKEAEYKAKMDEIAEKQRQRERELEEKEKQRREALLGRPREGVGRPSELPSGSGITEPGNAAPAAAAAAPASGKYVPRFRRERPESSGPPPPSEPDRWVKPAAPEPDRWAAGSRLPPPQSDRWTSGSRAPLQDPDRLGGGGSRAPPSSSDRPGGAGGGNKPEPWRPFRARDAQPG
ncbi:Eukaryotic translation initiation factor 3 subunit A [Hibiscus syriacus]|uniref:Eukaryotic translation initiation factor 3 subunit A n=1 Tax=Hibiscus syriacus TaxID=106335 RepID=A0A6A2YYT1_HIBSY|nr:Eukaryotic translation initiation factor 3 subunit A [Hibiscus syriacus]